MVLWRTVSRELHAGQQLPKVRIFILPIAVTANHSACRASAPEIQPFHVFAAVMKSNADGDFKKILATDTCAIFQLGLGEILTAIADWMDRGAPRTNANCRTLIFVQAQSKGLCVAGASGIRKLGGDVAVELSVSREFAADVPLGIAVPVLSKFLQGHAASPLKYG
jgi:hypothetical protein